ncbi:AraC family transcriptional regulator [Mucilaginibacter terrenus]|uniref:AraC family transcriptional regulator n=1 Tax=Mucilaginibacter terrenus TaxID=2482727 RepID=A0A3E2NPU3_9SPHI|nr:helix-turn-helix transcriptional regulator [Mucilaginibacter terrenus]RFZ82910.1 AraC family transcriptional regulator [Mucilaginibacter terrenus]
MLNPVTREPRSAILQKHIAYYYFMQTDSDRFASRYYAFPHTYTVFNIHRGAIKNFGDHFTNVHGTGCFEPVVSVQGIREHPLEVNLTGIIDKVTILFKPLGLNAFLDQPFASVITRPSQLFTSWDNLPAYKSFTKAFFGESDLDNRCKILESFLLTRYRSFPEHDLLSRFISRLSDFDESLPIEDICRQLQVQPRTLNRLFRKHLGVSPASYRKVARFRHSLQNKLVENQFTRMTELAYQSNYYDQAYFNKIYKELTGSNPHRFYKEIETLADERLVFRFMES